MKHLAITLFSASLLFACSNETIEGNGKVVEESREVSDFSGIRIENGLGARVSVGVPSLRLSLDSNLLEYVQSSVEGQDLVLRTRDEVNLEGSPGSGIIVTVPSLSHVELSGGSELYGDLGAPEAGYVTISASGGSDLDVTLDASEVWADASGGSDLRLTGSAREIGLAVSGGSDVNSNLPTEGLVVDASGGSDVIANASARASVTASGASDVTVRGGPGQRSVEASGSSDISFP